MKNIKAVVKSVARFLNTLLFLISILMLLVAGETGILLCFMLGLGLLVVTMALDIIFNLNGLDPIMSIWRDSRKSYHHHHYYY